MAEFLFNIFSVGLFSQLAYLKINTGKTLGKLHQISKIPLPRNGMAAIPKVKQLLKMQKPKKSMLRVSGG